jgi:hypothetical protein
MAHRTEEAEQARLIRWSHKVEVRSIAPELAWIHHSPNGGQRSGFTGAQMKALGTKPGFPDLILPIPMPDHPGLVIEMKSATGRLSPEQALWLDTFRAGNWSVHVCRSAEDARSVILDYLGITQAPALD